MAIDIPKSVNCNSGQFEYLNLCLAVCVYFPWLGSGPRVVCLCKFVRNTEMIWPALQAAGAGAQA